MKNYLVKKSTLHGTIIAPSSKSHSLRAILFASLAQGESNIYNVLASPDAAAMIAACQQLGAHIEQRGNQLAIFGVAGNPERPTQDIDAGNSGQVLRFIAAIAATLHGEVIITGDHSICTSRPVKPYIDALSQLGVLCEAVYDNNHAPLRIKGPMQGGVITVDGQDSQIISGLLIAATLIDAPITIHVNNPGELPWIDVTLSWLDLLGVNYINIDYHTYIIKGKTIIHGFNYNVPGDFSSISFPLVAAIITGSVVKIKNCDMNDVQGDKQLITVLQSMGALITVDNELHTITVHQGGILTGQELNINHHIDSITILAVACCFAKTESIISGAAIARYKECDRIHAIATGLKQMGANITETADGLHIKPASLKSTRVKSYHDHRMAMSLAVAGLTINGETIINDVTCVRKSYPAFLHDMQQLGANIEEII